MTPEEAARVQECIQEMGSILYKNTPPSELVSLETIDALRPSADAGAR